MFKEVISPDSGNFIFSLPVHIIFEQNGLEKLSYYLRKAGKKNALLIASKSAIKRFRALTILAENTSEQVKLTPWVLKSGFKASTDALHAIQEKLRSNNYDSIVSVGGGNIIDFGKVAAISLDSTVDIASVVGKTFDNLDKKLFHIAIPTTFGTGSEVTKGAIVFDSKRRIKEGVRGNAIFPDIALIDPCLGVTQPDDVLRETLFDSFTHAFEALHSVKYNPLAEGLALESLRRFNENIKRYVAGNLDVCFYTEAAFSALAGGICVCHNSTCLPHRFEQALSPFYNLSHGAGLAAIYPAWVKALEQGGKISPLLAQVSENKSASDYVAHVLRQLRLNSAHQQLAAIGISPVDIAKKVTGNIANDPLAVKPDLNIIATLLAEITGTVV